MRTRPRTDVLGVIRHLVSRHGEEQTSDRDLLRRFAEQHDGDAFSTLVRRHGAMVMGVGLRVLRHHQDAEDICQAAFLLLAKKATATAWRDSIANWLYEVAYHLALKTREAARRRTVRESQVQPKTPSDALADITLRDLTRVLDEELSRLPKKYRTPLILCCLEGKTRDEAARFLGVPLSTVSGRLEAGRKVLRRRLADRGVPLTLALAGVTFLSASAGAAVPFTVARATGQAAVQASAGEVLTNVVSEKVASLVKGALQAMFLLKLKLAAACGLACTIALAVAWAVLPNAAAQESPKSPQVSAAVGEKPGDQKKPQAPGGGTLLLARQGGLIALTPEGKEGAELTALKDTHHGFQGRLSPDGTQVAYTVIVNEPPRVDAPEAWPFKVVVRKLGAAKPSAVVDLPAQQLNLIWAADGKRLLVSKEMGARPNTSFETVLLDPATGKTEPFDLPEGVRVLDRSRDGKTFLVLHRKDKKYRLGLAAKGDREVRVLTELKGWTGSHVGRLSPDGKKVLYTDADPVDKDANVWGRSSKPYLLDVASKKRQLLEEFPENAQVMGLAWAPDGKRLAYTWMQLHPDLLKKRQVTGNDVQLETEAFLMVADPDGRNARVVASAKGQNAVNQIFGSVDWR